MPLNQAKIDAFKQLDAAVEAIDKAFKGEDGQQSVISGYLLLVSGVYFLEEEDEIEIDEFHDEQDMKAVLGVYDKRGQNPHLSLGMVTDYMAIARDQ